MLTDREVLSTINMLRSEHLDVRTVTMGINLFDCASSDFDTFAYKVRSKIFRYAEKLVETCDLVGDRYGIPVVNKRISVSPIGTVGASFSRDEMVAACRVLDESAKEVGVDFIGGFGALVDKGMTPGEKNLIDALPEALAVTDRICSSINVGSTKAGINMDAVRLMGQRILDVAEATRDRDAIGCAKLVVFCNIPQDVPFMAGAYLGVGEPDVVIDVGVSGPGVVKKALDRAFKAKGEFLTITDAAEVIKHTAYKVTRVGEIIGNEVANRLNLPFGVADLSLAPTPAVGDSVGETTYAVKNDAGTTVYTAKVSSFFGLKHAQGGYLWRMMDDEQVRINSDTTATHLVAPSIYGSWTIGSATGMKAYSISPATGEGYITRLSMEHLENFATAVGGSETTYWTSYFWNTSKATSGFRLCLRGCNANNGGQCGSSTLNVNNDEIGRASCRERV